MVNVEPLECEAKSLNIQAGQQAIHMMVLILADDSKARYDSLKSWLCTETNSKTCEFMTTLTFLLNAHLFQFRLSVCNFRHSEDVLRITDVTGTSALLC